MGNMLSVKKADVLTFLFKCPDRTRWIMELYFEFKYGHWMAVTHFNAELIIFMQGCAAHWGIKDVGLQPNRCRPWSKCSWFSSPIPDKETSKLATSFFSKHQLTWGWPHFNDVWKVGHCNPWGEVAMRCYWSIELLTLRLSKCGMPMLCAHWSEFQGQASATFSQFLREPKNPHKLKNIWRHNFFL